MLKTVASGSFGADVEVGMSTVGMDVTMNAAGPLAGLFAPSTEPEQPPTNLTADLLPVPTSPAAPAAPTTLVTSAGSASPATPVAPLVPPGLAHSEATAELPSASATSVAPTAGHGSVSRSSPQRKPSSRASRATSSSKRGHSSPPAASVTAPSLLSDEPTIREQGVPAGAEEPA